jgi:hypothetical protein
MGSLALERVDAYGLKATSNFISKGKHGSGVFICSTTPREALPWGWTAMHVGWRLTIDVNDIIKGLHHYARRSGFPMILTLNCPLAFFAFHNGLLPRF